MTRNLLALIHCYLVSLGKLSRIDHILQFVGEGCELADIINQLPEKNY